MDSSPSRSPETHTIGQARYKEIQFNALWLNRGMGHFENDGFPNIKWIGAKVRPESKVYF